MINDVQIHSLNIKFIQTRQMEIVQNL